MHTSTKWLVTMGMLFCLSCGCTPLDKTEEQVWNNGWSNGSYYAPHQTDL